jgi:hypothetical protein
MKLILLPLHNDEEVIRLRCEGPLSWGGHDDPLPTLLGPRCYHEKVLLSLEGCDAIDTSGLGWLLRSHKSFREAGGKLVLWAVQPLVADVLRFTRLGPLLNVATTEQAGCAMLREPPDPPAAPPPADEAAPRNEGGKGGV